MSRRLKRAGVVVAAVALSGAIAIGWHRFGPRTAPAGQPALVELSPSNVAAFSGPFDAAADRTRILALFSPT